MSYEDFYSKYSKGSTDIRSMATAFRLGEGTFPVATYKGRVLYADPELAMGVFGGAGSGKFTNLMAYFMAHPSTESMFVLSVGGQDHNVFFHNHLREGREAWTYCVDENLSRYGREHQDLDLWGVLRKGPLLFRNTVRVANMGIPTAASEGENAWVPENARRLVTALKTGLVHVQGRVTPESFWTILKELGTNDAAFKSFARATRDAPYGEFDTLHEFYRAKHQSQRFFSAVYSRIQSAYHLLSDPLQRKSLSGDIDYLALLADPRRKVAVQCCVEAGAAETEMSRTRMLLGIGMLHVERAASGSRPTFYIPEAALCGGMEELVRALSQNRKHFKTILEYQSHGQLTAHFGEDRSQEMIESIGMRIYMGGGLRSLATAREVAASVGRFTALEIDPSAQAAHIYQAEKSWRDGLLSGADIRQMMHEVGHEMEQSGRGTKTGRDAIDPAEALRLPKDKVLILAPGMGVQPIIADKLPDYWLNPMMAGRFAPDPLHPPTDRVTVSNRWRIRRTRRFIKQPCPSHLARMPQHRNTGQIHFVEGYRPW